MRASRRLWRRLLVPDVPFNCFRLVSSTPQNGFIPSFRPRNRSASRSALRDFRTSKFISRRQAARGVFHASQGGEGRQDSLSCAPWCAALSLGTILILTNLRPSHSRGRRVPPDDRHLAE